MALHRKIAFPFVTLVMTLIGVPFAVTTGRRGALYGVGVGIVLALVYWTMISVFAAFGAGGAMPPALAAWAPNLIFGACGGLPAAHRPDVARDAIGWGAIRPMTRRRLYVGRLFRAASQAELKLCPAHRHRRAQRASRNGPA